MPPYTFVTVSPTCMSRLLIVVLLLLVRSHLQHALLYHVPFVREARPTIADNLRSAARLVLVVSDRKEVEQGKFKSKYS